MHWLLHGLRQYAEFDGRATRREVGSLLLLLILIVVAANLGHGLVLSTGTSAGIATAFAVPLWIIVIGLILPLISASVRRLHDHDKPGWVLILVIIPTVGWIFWLFMMLSPGTNGPNGYGEDPRDDFANVADVF